MTLQDEFEKTGNWLFRWRSYLPLALIVLVLTSMSDYHFIHNSRFYDHIWEGLCFTISLVGMAIRVWTIGHTPANTSGRNTKKQIAGKLNTTGMYSIVRHPLYLGNYFILFGVMMLPHHLWALITFSLLFALYYGLIMYAEEAFLLRKFGDEWLEWAKKTPAFFPRFTNFQPSTLVFSVKNVLRREYSGFFAFIVSMFIIEVYGDWIVTGKIISDTLWLVILGIGLLTYITLRTIRKTTKWFEVQGR